MTFGIIIGFLVLVFVIFMAIMRYTIRRVPPVPPVPPKSLDERFWEIIEPLRYKTDTDSEENKVDPKG
jgi:hypothetical protein